MQGRRSQWTEHRDPVKQLRQREGMALEAKNDTSIGAVPGTDPPAVASMKTMRPNEKWLQIYIGDRGAQAFDIFSK